MEKKCKAENDRIMRAHPADPRADVVGDDAEAHIEEAPVDTPSTETATKI